MPGLTQLSRRNKQPGAISPHFYTSCIYQARSLRDITLELTTSSASRPKSPLNCRPEIDSLSRLTSHSDREHMDGCFQMGRVSCSATLEATCAAPDCLRSSLLYRRIFLTLPIRRLFVGPVCVSCSIKQVWMSMEIIPRDVANIMRKSFKHITERGRAINNSLGYEFLHNAVVDAE